MPRTDLKMKSAHRCLILRDNSKSNNQKDRWGGGGTRREREDGGATDSKGIGRYSFRFQVSRRRHRRNGCRVAGVNLAEKLHVKGVNQGVAPP